MSGHSKWSTIKHKKGVIDARRGQLFTKLGRGISLAARDGGGEDLSINFQLRLAVDRAKRLSMPKDNIERAILRGVGKVKGVTIEELQYEGYGPHGTALIVKVVTDNRNRSVSEVRSVFTQHGGNLGETGSVGWLFEQRGYVTITPKGDEAEELALMAIDSGAEDVNTDADLVEVFTKVQDLKKVQEALEDIGISFDSAQLSWIPKSMIKLDVKGALKNMRLIDALEALADVQEVCSNLEISAEAMAAYEAQE